MSELIFASNNLNKAEEIRSFVKDLFTFKTLKEAGVDIDIPEPFETLEENAAEKSTTIYTLTQQDCFSEDTGLFVEALDGAPGVKSARYAYGSGYENNVAKLMAKMENIENRVAYFRTVASLTIAGKSYLFDGKCQGTIIAKAMGVNGFGYDPVFRPKGAANTFAGMSLSEKNTFSHRRKAIESMITFIIKNFPGKYK
jgi:XTP/dITP diphosphohydrolase